MTDAVQSMEREGHTTPEAFAWEAGRRAGLEQAAAWLETQCLTDDDVAFGVRFSADYPAVAAAAIRAMMKGKP